MVWHREHAGSLLRQILERLCLVAEPLKDAMVSITGVPTPLAPRAGSHHHRSRFSQVPRHTAPLGWPQTVLMDGDCTGTDNKHC